VYRFTACSTDQGEAARAIQRCVQYKQEYEIELNPDVTPTVQPARRVPYAKYEKLKDTLEQLEKRGIVAKVDKPTDWVSNLVITEKKDGRMRIC